MNLESVGTVVAKREFDHVDGHKIVIQIGLPQPFPEGSPYYDGHSYYCPFQIQGTKRDKIFFGAGVDSVQALRGAMNMLRATFCSSDEMVRGEVKWIGGGESKDLGLDDLTVGLK